MPSALEKLLSRPSSIELLAYLVRSPSISLPTISSRARQLCVCENNSYQRLYSSVTVPIRRVATKEAAHTSYHEPRAEAILHLSSHREPAGNSEGSSRLPRRGQSGRAPTVGNGDLWKGDDLEYESNFSNPSTFRQRLVDLPGHGGDMGLWISLLEYRQRIYGVDGTRMVWNAMRKRGVRIPTDGPLASKFWTMLIDAGVQDEQLLQELWKYAENVLESSGQRWSRLYVSIVTYLLLHGRGQEALDWHNILIADHPPHPNDFTEMFRQIALKGGDLEALRTIYEKQNCRGVYGKVVPILCEQEDFNSAIDWHFLFMQNGDLPLESKAVEPLVLHLAVYDRANARRVTQSLVDKGVSFGPLIASTLNGYHTISREVMNLIHGETFHVKVKPYNDSLGARWFATKWVSLDLAINTVHALGIQEIGPLSLQAIALRDMDCKSITQRIQQLKRLGISIGTSFYSRAIEEFAAKGKVDFLEGLLLSDQHPDTLEDWKLQEALLSHYAKNQDWSQYKRTLAIRLLGSESYDTEIQNHTLVSQVGRHDIPAVLETLSKMNTSGIVVRAKTVSHILRMTLRPRQRGRAPISEPTSVDDLSIGINILTDILKSGGSVPATYWREIFRRLGMLGRFDELERLSIFLASWYYQAEDLTKEALSEYRRENRQEMAPAQVPTSHPLHPLRILFPVPLQKAIVEWGFIHGLTSWPADEAILSLTGKNTQLTRYPFTRGILLLKELGQRGVNINSAAIRSAIFNRLMIYYGPGRSNRRYNRIARARNRLTLEEMANQIDIALGSPAFPGLDLRNAIENSGRSKRRLGRGGREKLPRSEAP